MKIADTSQQDVLIEKTPNRKRQLVIGVIALVFILFTFWAVPAVQRWAGSSVTVPLDRLRLAAVELGDLVRDVSIQGRVVPGGMLALIVIGQLAVFGPARKASKVPPAVATRTI